MGYTTALHIIWTKSRGEGALKTGQTREREIRGVVQMPAT